MELRQSSRRVTPCTESFCHGREVDMGKIGGDVVLVVPAAPVYLLHGAADPIIGPEESRRLADTLGASGARARVHVTDVFDHVDAGEPSLLSTLSLARFLAGFLAAAGG